MDFNAMADITAELKKEQEKQGGNFERLVDWKVKEGDPLEIRLLLPNPVLGNSYYAKEVKFKINNAGKWKFPLSMETFNEPCVMDDLFQTYRKHEDPVMREMAKDYKKIGKQVNFLMNVIVIEDDVPTGDPIIFGCSLKTLQQIHAIVADPKQVKAGKGESIMSRVSGRSIILSKMGKVLNINADPTTLDLSGKEYDTFYDFDNQVDLVENSKKQVKSDAHLQSIIKNYFEGSEIVEDDGVRKGLMLESTEETTEKDDVPFNNEPEAKKIMEQTTPITPVVVADTPVTKVEVKEEEAPAKIVGNPLLSMIEDLDD